MSANYSLKRDLDELVEMSDRLGEYILGNALYMPVGGGFLRGGGSPQLSAGAFLLRRRRLRLLRGELDAGGRALLDAALKAHDDIQREWALHYEKKLLREGKSRLQQMAAFFRDCRESPGDCAAAYPVEALRRSIVQEILGAMDEFAYDAGELRARARQCDSELRRYLKPSRFIWSRQLQPVYPRETFWWLYGAPEG